MPEVKHTPGPWEVQYDNGDDYLDGQWYNAGPARVLFPYSPGDDVAGRALADARMVAAAPELFRALVELLDAYCSVMRSNHDSKTRGEWTPHRDNDTAAINATEAIKRASS